MHENPADPWTVPKLSIFYAIHLVIVYYTYMRNLRITEAEETALVNALLFIQDLGVPPHLEEDEAFDSLWDKVTDPEPAAYF